MKYEGYKLFWDKNVRLQIKYTLYTHYTFLLHSKFVFINYTLYTERNRFVVPVKPEEILNLFKSI